MQRKSNCKQRYFSGKKYLANDDIKSLHATVEGKNLSSRGVVFVNNNQIRGVNDGSADYHAVNKRQLEKNFLLMILVL